MARSAMRGWRRLRWMVLALPLIVLGGTGWAQDAAIPGSENAPKVGAEAPAFNLEGYDLGKQEGRGPILLLFYRGFF